MPRAVPWVVAFSVLVLGCDPPTDERTPTTGNLHIQVTRAVEASDSAALARASMVDAARARIIGPEGPNSTARVVSLTLRESAFVDTIGGLTPGSYTVALEGLIGSLVEEFGQTDGVTVIAGRNTTASIVVGSFQPTITSIDSLPGALGFIVNISPVTGAESYTVAWDTDSTFSNASQSTVAASGGTSIEVAVGEARRYYARVSAINQYGADGTWSDSVSVGLLVPVATIEVSPSSATMTAVGDTLQLSVVVRDENGDPIAGKPVSLTSSDDRIATVSPGGAVVAIANGAVTITASADTATAQATVTVSQVTETVTVVAPADTLFIGGSFQFLGAARDRRGNPNPDAQLAWDSSDPTLAIVDTAGTVDALAEGDVTISATHEGVEGSAAVTVTTATFPTGGLVADYPFTGNATDASSNGNDGTLFGPLLTTDRFGNANSAYAFDGVDDYIDIGPDVKPALPFTVSLWVRDDAGTGGLLFKNDRWDVDVLGLYRGARIERTDAGAVVARTGTGNLAAPQNRAGQLTADGSSSPGSWHHVAVIFVAHDSMQFYVNGALLASSQTNGTSSTMTYSSDQPGTIGGSSWNGEAFFGGAIDDVRVFDRPLTAQEIVALVADTGAAAQPVDTVVILPADPAVEERDTLRLTAQPRDATDTPFEGLSISWGSEDPGIATVDGSGLVTGVLFGTVAITATAGGVTDSISVTVTPFPVDSVAVTPFVDSLAVGASVQLGATPFDSLGNELLQRTVTWSTDDALIASVDATGLVTGEGVGTATITATVDGVTGDATIEVFSDAPVATVTVTPAMSTIPVGGDVQLSAELRDADGNLLIDRPVTWESDAPTTVSVNSAGLASGVTIGTATITATSEGVSDGATVTVEAVASTYQAVDAAHTHTCAVTTNGVMFCWGANSNGELGDGSTTNSSVPVRVFGGLLFDSVAVARVHTCGLTADGEAFCWGNGSAGRLGTGNQDGSIVALPVAGDLDFSVLEAHQDHTCGVTSDATGYCWGKNDRELFTTSTGVGRLGDGTDINRSVPTAVAGGLRWGSIVPGWWHSCGVTSDGSSYCWGSNAGRFGDGAEGGSVVPVATSGGLTFSIVDAGENHTCGIAASLGWCWGLNGSGQLGDSTTTQRLVPVRVTGGLAFSEIGAGNAFSCGLTTGGQAYCWGQNTLGQLGDGTNDDSLAPVPVAGGLTFVSLSVGGQFTCGITATDEVYCWGRGGEGQLGDGASANSNVPVRAATP